MIHFVACVYTNDIFHSIFRIILLKESFPPKESKNEFMINLMKRAILEKITFAKKDFRYSQVIKMEIHTTKQTINKMSDPEVKRKSSPLQNHSQKSKYRKKNSKHKNDKLANANEMKPYTWFLAIPSKY